MTYTTSFQDLRGLEGIKSQRFQELRRLEAFLPSSGRPAKEAKNTSRRMERPNVKRVC